MECEDVDWIKLAQDRTQRQRLYETSDFIQSGNFRINRAIAIRLRRHSCVFFFVTVWALSSELDIPGINGVFTC
jgi:hypothetical protein